MIKICCDFCERVLPVDTVEDIEFARLSRTKELKTSDIFPHLCENCASKIDIVLRKYKDSVTKGHILTEQYAKLNAERKERVGTKG